LAQQKKQSDYEGHWRPHGQITQLYLAMVPSTGLLALADAYASGMGLGGYFSRW